MRLLLRSGPRSCTPDAEPHSDDACGRYEQQQYAEGDEGQEQQYAEGYEGQEGQEGYEGQEGEEQGEQ